MASKIIDREEYNTYDNEHAILGSMIADDEVISSAYLRYKSGELKTKHFTEDFRQIFRWLIIYYSRQGSAPKNTIQKIFEDKRKTLSSESQELIEEYLDVITEEYAGQEAKTIDPVYIRREVIPNFIRERELERRLEQAQARIERGEFSDAEDLISDYSKVSDEEVDESLGTFLPYTIEDVDKGFSKEYLPKEAFHFNNDLATLIGPLCNTWLVAVTGIEKSGKSYILQEMAYQAALRQNKKVLIVNLELSEPIVRNRLYRRLTQTAMERYAGRHLIPILDCENNQYGTCKYKKSQKNKKPLFRNNEEMISWYNKRKWRTCDYCRGKTKRNAARTKRFIPVLWFDKLRIEKLTKSKVKNALDDMRFKRLSNLRVKCYPRFSVTFDETREYILRYIEKNNWKPNIIIYDYLDILATESGTQEGRHDIDRKWKKASKLGGELDALILTADQATKATRTQYALDQMSTSESKTKDSHLDVRIAYNQTAEEKKVSVGRISVLFHRHELFNVKDEVIITQNISTAQPILDCAFLYDRGKRIKVTNKKF